MTVQGLQISVKPPERQVESFIDMPERMIDLLFRFLQQNEGQISKRAREREFKELTDAESRRIESAYQAIFKEGEPE